MAEVYAIRETIRFKRAMQRVLDVFKTGQGGQEQEQPIPGMKGDPSDYGWSGLTYVEEIEDLSTGGWGGSDRASRMSSLCSKKRLHY